MGFFSKIKQNFSHGGIQLTMQAPSSVSESDASFTVIVTLTNEGTTSQQIKQLEVKLVEDHTRQQSQTNSAGMQPNRDIATAQQSTPFTVNPGEAKAVELTVAMNIGKYVNEVLPDNGLVNAAAKVLGGIQTVTETIQNQNYEHYIEAIADVEGITFDPSARSRIQLLKPGHIGTSINMQL